MKKFEKQTFIDTDKLCIIRLDGTGMAKRFRTNQIINETFEAVMEKTMLRLMEYFSSAILAYQCSDGISILFDLRKKDEAYQTRLENEILYRTEKLITIAASLAGTAFTNAMNDRNEYFFDCRLIQPEKEKLQKYFDSRQGFILNMFLENLRNFTIDGKIVNDNKIHGSKSIIEALKALDKPIIYENFPKSSRNGLLMYRSDGIIIAEDAEVFIEDRNYLDNLLSEKVFASCKLA